MSSKYAVTICGLVIAFSFLANESRAEEKSQPVVGDRWPVALGQVGRKLKCYFTIESAELKLGEHALEGLRFSNVDEIKSVDELLLRLGKETKGFSFLRNKMNPAIIHVIDDRVKRIHNYALERQTSLALSGALSDISVELGKTFRDVGPKVWGDWREMGDDSVTKVKLEVHERRVRDLLTDSVPLKDYGPFLWRAETRTFGKNAGTMIQFFGPKSNSASRYNYDPEDR